MNNETVNIPKEGFDKIVSSVVELRKELEKAVHGSVTP